LFLINVSLLHREITTAKLKLMQLEQELAASQIEPLQSSLNRTSSVGSGSGSGSTAPHGTGTGAGTVSKNQGNYQQMAPGQRAQYVHVTQQGQTPGVPINIPPQSSTK